MRCISEKVIANIIKNKFIYVKLYCEMELCEYLRELRTQLWLDTFQSFI